MFAHNLQLGFCSLKRNPALTALMVVAIGFGIAASMTTWAVFRAASGNPIPGKSGVLFVPQIDNWSQRAHTRDNEPPTMLSYIDATALMRAHVARRQAAMYPVESTVIPVSARAAPFPADGYATYADFFAMFGVPFRYGHGWSPQEDDNRANVVVITDSLNRKLFGDVDSTGRQLSLGQHDYRIVGVTEDWNPQPRFYDVDNLFSGAYGDPPSLFMPFTLAIDLKIPPHGDKRCNSTLGGTGWDATLKSECVWILFWTELHGSAEVRHYRQFLHNYAAQQQSNGRFGWSPNVRLRNLEQWLDYRHVVPPETRISLVVAIGLLVVCLVNTIGLLLAKFMRRAPEIGLRRALGASRRAIYAQFVAEAAMVGVAGGVLGLLLALAGVLGARMVFGRDIARLVHVDPALVGLTLLLAVCATLVAAFYPIWRMAQVQPAWQLKVN